MRAAQGHIEASRSILVDITDRKRQEAALHDSKERLSRIFELAMDAIVTIDEEEHIILFNAAAEKTFRCPSAGAIGRPLGRFLSKAFERTLANYLLALGKPSCAQRYMSLEGLTAFRTDGDEFPIDGTLSQVEVAVGISSRSFFATSVNESQLKSNPANCESPRFRCENPERRQRSRSVILMR
jgi:PAS domain S-box-containing protein